MMLTLSSHENTHLNYLIMFSSIQPTQQNAFELISAHGWEIELVKTGQFVYDADYVDTNQLRDWS